MISERGLYVYGDLQPTSNLHFSVQSENKLQKDTEDTLQLYNFGHLLGEVASSDNISVELTIMASRST
jgi:gamma-glutamylcyclotransferase (GGCT)/AIG2-like uncharacterized protein YtfP